MNRTHLATALIVLVTAFGASVANAASKPVTSADKKEAEARYVEDKKLCAEETSSNLRMQCLRDAKDEYNKALAGVEESTSRAATAPSAVCADCGRVTGVKVVEKKGKSTPLGLIAGGVAGAVLGHQVGAGRGKDVATLAGAAGGAYAGHKIEESARSTKSWVVSVQFDNGDQKDFSFDADPGYAAGDGVKLSGNSIVRH